MLQRCSKSRAKGTKIEAAEQISELSDAVGGVLRTSAPQPCVGCSGVSSRISKKRS